MLKIPWLEQILETHYFSPDIVTVSKDFKYPQVFQTNLALEQMLPGDVK